MNLTLSAIADLVQGTLHGDGQLLITGAATLATAKPGEITLADSLKQARHLAASAATAVNVACFGSSTGEIQLATTGGTTPFSYNWSGGIVSQNRTAIPAWISLNELGLAWIHGQHRHSAVVTVPRFA